VNSVTDDILHTDMSTCMDRIISIRGHWGMGTSRRRL